jgi:vacuolar-type H+-ATPase subunit E/Vma4
MDNISAKVKKFQESCMKLAKDEASSLDKKVKSNIKSETEDEIKKYREDAKNKFERQLHKLEKDYNSKTYELKNKSQKTIIHRGKGFLKSLEFELSQRLYMFTDLREYEIYFIKNLEETLLNLEIENDDEIEIYTTNKDFEKYLKDKSNISNFNFLSNNIKSLDNLTLKFLQTDEEIIGGTIGKNTSKKVQVDNSLKVALNQEISNLNLNY